MYACLAPKGLFYSAYLPKVRLPHVVQLAQILFTIPESKTENKRGISVARILYDNRRKRVAVGTLDSIT